MANTAIELFDSQAADLPRIRSSHQDFRDDLKAAFRSYNIEVSGLRAPDGVTQRIAAAAGKISDLEDAILIALNESLAGHPDMAASTIQAGLKIVQDELNILMSVQLTSTILNRMFRARKKDAARVLSRTEMFHIRFEDRHKVGPQRYSFPGLPCLYLGGSSYVCWEELGRPPIQDLVFSRMEAAAGHTIRVLNLGYRPAHMAGMLTYNLNHLSAKQADIAVAHAVIWPLVAACSYKILLPDFPFKPEWVVPQLLLRWVVNSPDHDGIRYFSTHINGNYTASTYVMNFVFPARSNGYSGICNHLGTKIHLTNPVDINQIPNSFVPKTGSNPPPGFLFPYLGSSVQFSASPFSRLEQYLETMPVGPA